MSWLYSRALVEEYSRGICSDGGPCAPLNLMPTAQPFSRNGKTMDCSSLSRFGPKCAPLTVDRGEALLTSFRAAFPVRTSASPERATDSTASDQDFGFKWPASFAKWDRVSCSWKTRQRSLLEDSTAFSETLPRWGSMRDGELSVRPTAALPTCENESGSSPMFPTPVDASKGGGSSRSGDRIDEIPSLQGMARRGLWPTPQSYSRGNSKSTPGLTPLDIAARPEMQRHAERAIERRKGIPMIPTPTAGDAKSSGSRNTAGSQAHFGLSLTDFVRQDAGTGRWPTPQAQDAKQSGARLSSNAPSLSSEIIRRGTWPTPRAEDSQCAGGHRGQDDTLYGVICRPKDGTSAPGQLNPTWVEWLMGWPLGWTDCAPLGMDRFREWLQQHGSC